MEARFEVSRRESPNQRNESERTSDTICESRSLARVAVVVTLFLVIATRSTNRSKPESVLKGNGRNCTFNWINVQVIDSFVDRPLICYQPAYGRRPRITSGSRKQGVNDNILRHHKAKNSGRREHSFLNITWRGKRKPQRFKAGSKNVRSGNLPIFYDFCPTASLERVYCPGLVVLAAPHDL